MSFYFPETFQGKILHGLTLTHPNLALHTTIGYLSTRQPLRESWTAKSNRGQRLSRNTLFILTLLSYLVVDTVWQRVRMPLFLAWLVLVVLLHVHAVGHHVATAPGNRQADAFVHSQRVFEVSVLQVRRKEILIRGQCIVPILLCRTGWQFNRLFFGPKNGPKVKFATSICMNLFHSKEFQWAISKLARKMAQKAAPKASRKAAQVYWIATLVLPDLWVQR